METLIPVIIALIIFVVVVWLIGLLPLPTGPFPVKALLYILAAVVLIIYLWRFAV